MIPDAIPKSRAPRRILQVFNRYLMPGGEENSVVRIASHLELAGHQVTRFWRASEEWTQPDAPPRWRQLFLMWENPSVLADLRLAHEKAGSEVWILHNVLPVVSLGVYRLAKELGVPIVHWLHNYRPISPSGLLRAGGKLLQPDDPWIACKETLAGSWRGAFPTAWLALGYHQVKSRGDFDSVKAWLAISEEMKGVFERAGFGRGKLHTLIHSWDIQPPLNEGKDDGYFLFLGRMVEEKGVRFIVDLWRQPAFKNIELVMAGQGPLADELRGQSPSNIRWAGFVRGDDKRKLVAGARAVLFPCLWSEPLGTVVYEAFEQARPVIGSDIGGLRDLILDGRTGRRLPPGDDNAWSQVLLQFAHDPALANELGRNGMSWMNENVSPVAWNERFDRILETVLGQPYFRR